MQVQSIHQDRKKAKGAVGSITIVDLAGSERLNQSHTEGERLVETKAINRSLTALKDVISALSKKEKHVPYRNSKLTFVLQNYLGKDSKTLVIINVSPCASHYNQTLGSLRFGYMLKNCSPICPRPEKLKLFNLFGGEESNQKTFSGLKLGSNRHHTNNHVENSNRKIVEEKEGVSTNGKRIQHLSSNPNVEKIEEYIKKHAYSSNRKMDEEEKSFKSKSGMFGWENRNLLIKDDDHPENGWSSRSHNSKNSNREAFSNMDGSKDYNEGLKENSLLRTPKFK